MAKLSKEQQIERLEVKIRGLKEEIKKESELKFETEAIKYIGRYFRIKSKSGFYIYKLTDIKSDYFKCDYINVTNKDNGGITVLVIKNSIVSLNALLDPYDDEVVTETTKEEFDNQEILIYDAIN